MGWNIPGRSPLILLYLWLSLFLYGQESFVRIETSVLSTDFLFTEQGDDFFPLPENEVVQQTLERYKTNWARDYLSRVELRSLPYRYTVSFLLWEAQIPQSLLNLPVIESGWDIHSLSSSGAFGIWQFMKNSIPRSFVDDRWRDDRGDMILSTEAAISKFNFNLNKTSGDWLLALAGYNCGINHITRSLEASNGTDYWSLREEGFLPDQTEEYIPRFLVVNHILGHKVQYLIPLNWEKSPYWLALPVDKPIFLPALAERLDIDLDYLMLANGELKDWFVPFNEFAYRIKIPSNRINLYLEDKNPGIISGEILSDSNSGEASSLPHRTYLVQEGDTLWKIAETTGTTVEQLQQKNDLEESGILLPGILLFLP